MTMLNGFLGKFCLVLMTIHDLDEEEKNCQLHFRFNSFAGLLKITKTDPIMVTMHQGNSLLIATKEKRQSVTDGKLPLQITSTSTGNYAKTS